MFKHTDTQNKEPLSREEADKLIAEELPYANAHKAIFLSDPESFNPAYDAETIQRDDHIPAAMDDERHAFVDDPEDRTSCWGASAADIYNYLQIRDGEPILEYHSKYEDQLNMMLLGLINDLDCKVENDPIYEYLSGTGKLDEYLHYFRYLIATDVNLDKIIDQVDYDFDGFMSFKMLLAKFRAHILLLKRFIPKEVLQPLLAHKLLFEVSKSFTNSRLQIPAEFLAQLTVEERTLAQERSMLADALNILTTEAAARATVKELVEMAVPVTTAEEVGEKIREQATDTREAAHITMSNKAGEFLQAFIRDFPDPKAFMTIISSDLADMTN